MNESITIYTSGGDERRRVCPLPRSVYKCELMAEEYVLLCFNSDVYDLQAGDYIMHGGIKFKAIERADISRSGRGWQIEQRFVAPWMEWKHRLLFFDRGSSSENAWTMTQGIAYFADIVKSNIKSAGMGDYGVTVEEGLGGMKTLSFDGTDIVSALGMIAQEWETEWWVSGSNICFGLCQYGEAVTLTDGDEIAEVSQSDTKDGAAVTRLYAFGSTRNIPSSYRPDDKAVVSGVAERNLHLPKGTEYIDARPDLKDVEVVEGTAIFEDVYPRRVGTISSISTKEYTDTDEESGEKTKWNAYRFKDSGLSFSEKYVLPGQELRMVFEDGQLAGMDFALVFNPDNKDESEAQAQIFEIVRSDDYGLPMPNDTMKPQVGDKYVLYGYDTSFVADTLVADAEKELLEVATKWMEEQTKDQSVYECKMDEVRCKGYRIKNEKLTYDESAVIDLHVGAPVRFVSDLYGDRESRVRAVEVRIDGRGRTYTIGKSASYSRLGSIESNMEAQKYTMAKLSSSGGVYVIGTNDHTPEADSNVYSSLRSKQDFLSKRQNDSTPHNLTVGSLDIRRGMVAGEELSSGNASIGGDFEVQGASTLTAVTADTIVTGELTATKADTGDLTTDTLSAAGGTTTVNSDGIRTQKEANMRTVVFGDYLPGLITGAEQGAKVDESGDAAFKSVSISGYLEVPEIRFNRATVQLGIGIRSVGGGIIEEVIPDTDADGNILLSGRAALKLEDGEIGAISIGDKCLGFWHNLTGNSAADRDDRNGDYELRGFSSVYFRIDAIFASEQAYRDYDTAATDDGCINKYFHYVLRGSDVTDGWNQRHHPSPSMHFGMIANNICPDRQALKIETTQYDLSLTRMTEWNYTHSNIVEVGGLLDGFSMQAERYNAVTGEYETYTKEFQGHGRVMGNCYIFGQIDKFERQGYYCTVFQSKNGFIMPNETEMETVRVYTGYGEEVTEKFPYIKVTRDSGDSASDAVWNAEHASVDNPFPITFADLRIDAIERISTEFHVYASDGVNQTRTSTIIFE